MKDSEILIRARKLVAQGWCQKQSYRREDNSYCISGAISAACRTVNSRVGPIIIFAENLPEASKYFTEINEILGDSIGADFGIACWKVVSFNDNKDTTKEEVLEKFSEAIALALKKEKTLDTQRELIAA